MVDWALQILETPKEMEEVEYLQRLIWSGSETEVVPAHILLAMVHNGGIAIGAYLKTSGDDAQDAHLESHQQEVTSLIGFVFGFPGLYTTPDGPRPKHCSHMLGVHPDYRGHGIGFGLKRAQWQMVRYQEIDRITWTYDPLLSRNAFLNITRLGAVCSTYRRNEYGELRDDLNVGLPSDRFQVDWWVNSKRVERRLSRKARLPLDLAHFLAAGAEIVNPTKTDDSGLPQPGTHILLDEIKARDEQTRILLLEIPADFLALKLQDKDLAIAWRTHTRELFEELFSSGYLVTDFIYLPGKPPRSYYVLSHGESTL